ncbi:bile acid:sodium symporter family protein [Telmatospirillum siberiense]|uniref:Bile acid:sodium symporter n=1 Tax=Telmatospirillum siberiense TaxID=382514 RepID=A0A2N3PLZ9_9PROT|nr:bile acid:sodium symporter family protein [Telmatospirillum siberiense]PKU21422.1 bile acid:sodium symporter [Telmatospirillum siberiense]
MSALARLRPDNFTLLLVGTVLFATVLPCSGQIAEDWKVATEVAVALLFFLHGARLSREAVFAGLTHWRLHLTVFASTFVYFPILGLLTAALPASMLSPALGAGIIFLCCLPSTVQSSIAFTSIAGGNVPAAICSASVSSLLGVFLTPLLVGLLMSAHGGDISLDSIESIIMQLLVPFVVGQLLRPWIGAWALRHKKLLGVVDRGSILMVVYGAFSEAVVNGLWHQLTPESTAGMVIVNIVLLGVALTTTTWAARRMGFNREDEITIVFCGSKKSLVAGVPMANILFAGHSVGMIVLPLMLFHQIQLMTCAVLARRYAKQAEQAAE